MKQPKVSVVMSVYNSEDYVAQTIKSVLSQTFKNFEFIIINDGSKDRSLKIIKSFKDPRIRLIDRANKGLTYSLNEGLKLARGIYFARQDSDDLSAPTRLAKEVKLLDADPDLGLVGSNYTIIDEQDRPKVTTNVFTHPDDLKLALITCNQYGHGSIMARTALFRELGGYDASVGHVEDYDLWTRVSRVAKVMNIQEPLYMWRSNPTGISNTNLKLQIEQTFAIRDREFKHVLSHRSHYRLFSSYHPDWPGYRTKKAALYRNLAYLYRRQRKLGWALAMMGMALIYKPQEKRNYKRLLMLLNAKWFRRWGFEFL